MLPLTSSASSFLIESREEEEILNFKLNECGSLEYLFGEKKASEPFTYHYYHVFPLVPYDLIPFLHFVLAGKNIA